MLGVIINDQLTWDPNTESLVKRANARMRLLQLVEFDVPHKDLLNIDVLYVRSILEQSCQVWHSSLTLENITDLERIQKNALKIILKGSYVSYEQALDELKLESLYDRRELLCLKFAKKCTKSSQVKDMFPINPMLNMKMRHPEKYKVNMARTDRLKDSAIPFMQRLLNQDFLDKDQAEQ